MTVKFPRIPSWLVAAVGGGLVLAATAIGATCYQKVSSDRAKLATEASSLKDRADRLWASHMQGDQRETAANVFISLALSDGPRTSQHAFDKAAHYLGSALLAMWVAAGDKAAGAVPLNVEEAKSNLRQGNLTAYKELSAAIGLFRNKSAGLIKDLDEQADTAKARAMELDARQNFIYFLQVALNLLGLCLVMCKDLPIWLSPSRKE